MGEGGRDTAALVARLLDVIEFAIAPKTRSGVAEGNKIFGAAILDRRDLRVVIAETNNETANPIWHGEMHAIRRFYELGAADRPEPKDCLFLATHEPCSLCLSGITWAGFDNFYYLFSHEDSRDSFAIPYDIQILKAVYAVPDPDRAEAAPDRPLYNCENAYWSSYDIMRLIAQLSEPERQRLLTRVEELRRVYAGLSDLYQSGKGASGIPHA